MFVIFDQLYIYIYTMFSCVTFCGIIECELKKKDNGEDAAKFQGPTLGRTNIAAPHNCVGNLLLIIVD
jgi:hypothetical protein